MDTITLKDITVENWRTAVRLKLGEGQDKFVAPNWYSILEALYEEGLTSCGIYLDETMIGYAMYGFEPDTREYWIARLMVAEEHQGKGYGRAALKLIIEDLKAREGCDAIYISITPANEGARHLYTSLGFEDTGRVEHGEQVLRMAL